MADLKPMHIVPGHGGPSDVAHSRVEVYNYLKNLNTRISEVLKNNGEIKAAISVNQEALRFLHNFEQLARRNAQEVFIQLEFDF
tara:strand:- start:62 stop:313 length:252 start_codon:yes stop_codon:yes gene_type:complete